LELYDRRKIMRFVFFLWISISVVSLLKACLYYIEFIQHTVPYVFDLQ